MSAKSVRSGGLWVVAMLWFTAGAGAQPLSVDPASLAFTYEPGTAPPARQSVKVDSTLFGLRLSPPEITPAGAWLAASLAFQSTPDTLTVTVNPVDLPPGKYQGSITVTSPSAPSLLTRTIPVDLTVSSTISLQHQLGFSPAPPRCFAVDMTPGSPLAISADPTGWLIAVPDPAAPRR